MSKRTPLTDDIQRRGVLAALAAGLSGTGIARNSLARDLRAAARNADSTEYVVEQGDRCIPVTPLSGDETAEAFYDYRTPYTSPSGAAYSSYGTTDLQRPETSLVFLYDGPEGLSLVVLHDKLNDGTPGGAATFEFRLAHPDRGSWVVGDDDYDAPSNYDTFTDTATGWRVDWTWSDGRSDGGVYRPLGGDFSVTIDPAFNEAAALYGDPYEGRITDWQVLSGDRSSPERVSLALDQPLTIRTGTCGGTTTTTTTERTTTEEREDEERSSGPISVAVEVVPGRVNPRSNGRLPVVVHSSEAFDATTLDPGTVEFGPGNASPVHAVRTDHDGDGRTDLKLHFWMDATGIGWGDDRVTLTGKTERGRPVRGVADLRLVPNGGDDEDERDERREERREEREERREERRERKEEKREERRERREEKSEEEREEREEEDEKREEEDGDDDGHPGKGRGRGNGRGRGKGRGRGNGRGDDG